ncbi:hypothetical protein ACFL0W_00105 [Nanoarchaeota archaeon]
MAELTIAESVRHGESTNHDRNILEEAQHINSEIGRDIYRLELLTTTELQELASGLVEYMSDPMQQRELLTDYGLSLSAQRNGSYKSTSPILGTAKKLDEFLIECHSKRANSGITKDRANEISFLFLSASDNLHLTREFRKGVFSSGLDFAIKERESELNSTAILYVEDFLRKKIIPERYSAKATYAKIGEMMYFHRDHVFKSIGREATQELGTQYETKTLWSLHDSYEKKSAYTLKQMMFANDLIGTYVSKLKKGLDKNMKTQIVDSVENLHQIPYLLKPILL